MEPFYTPLKNITRKLVPLFIACFFMQQATAQNNALNYIGGEKVSVSTGSLTVSGDYTVEAWVMPSAPVGGEMSIFSSRANGDNTFDMKLTASGVHGDIGDGNGGWLATNADATFPIVTNQWYHIAYVVTTGHAYIYINGKLLSTITLSSSNTPILVNPTHNLIEIGRYANENFVGNIDEVRVYTAQRSSSEIIFDMGHAINNPPTEPNLFAYYNFNMGVVGGDNTSVNFLPDASANHIHGTLSGFALTGAVSNWVTSYSMVVPVANGASDIHSTGFSANWDAALNVTPDNYVLQLSTDANFTTIVGTYNPTGTSQAITGLISGTQYWYRVKAVSGAMQSVYSNVITAAPAPLTAMTRGATNILKESFTALWTAPAAGVANGYVLEVADDADFTHLVTAPFNTTATSQDVTGLTRATQYWYRVAVINSENVQEPAYSDTNTVTTSLNNLVSTAATAITSSGFTANWEVPETGEPDSYTLEVANDGDFTTLAYSIPDITGTSFDVTLLLAESNYSYRIATVHGGVQDPGYSNVINVTTNAVMISTATAATNVTASGFTANWDAPTTGTASSYVLEVADDVDFNNIVTTYYPTGTTQDVTGLNVGTTYWYRVAVINSAGTQEDGYSNTISTTTVLSLFGSIGGGGLVCSSCGCSTPTISFSGDLGTAPYTFTYNINGGPNQTISTTGANTDVDLEVPGIKGGGDRVYTLISVSDVNGNPTPQTGSATITVLVTDTTIYQTICSSALPYRFNGFDYYGAGTYSTVITNEASCDSTINLVLTVTGTSNTLVTINQDQLPYNWNGVDYNAGGVYAYKTAGATCDSVAILRLTVNVPAPPADFSYSSPNTFTKDMAISSLSPAVEAPGTLKAVGPTFYQAESIARDTSGNLYVTDIGFGTVTKVTPAGKSSPVADGSFYAPFGIAVDVDQNIYVSDAVEGSVKKVSAADGSVSVVSYDFSQPYGIALDRQGRLFVADGDAVKVIEPGGSTPSTFWSNYNLAASVATDVAGNVYVGDAAGLITKISADGYTIIPIAALPDQAQPTGISLDEAGNIYVTDSYNGRLYKITPDGTVSPISDGSFINPTGVASDSSGNLYVVDGYTGGVKKVSGGGGAVTGYTIAPALPTGMTINAVSGIISGTPSIASKQKAYTVTAVNANGKAVSPVVITVTNVDGEKFGYNTPNVFIKGKTITNITPVLSPVAPAAGTRTSLGSGFNLPFGVAVDADGNIYVADSYNGVVKKMDADGNNITEIGTGLVAPLHVALDAAGYVYVADYGDDAIKKIAPDGVTTTVLGSGFSEPQSVAVDGTGNVYVADFGHDAISVIAPDGVTVTQLGSGFDHPVGVDVDTHGNVYVADFGNHAVKRITTANVVETVISNLANIFDVKVDGADNIYLITNDLVRKTTADLTTTTKIGGNFNGPSGIALDADGNVYVADTYNNKIKKIQGTGVVISRYTVDPALPTGLSFNETTGVISGKPKAGLAPTPYTVTAEREAGNLTTQVTLQVNVFDTVGAKVCATSLPYNWNGVDYPAAGTYSGFFTNANGYDSTVALRLITTTGITSADLAPIAGTAAACFGANKGLQVTVTGGTKPYQYSINSLPYKTSNSFAVPPGSYTVNVKDAAGCTIVTNNVDVIQPASALTLAVATVRTTCAGDDGSITITAAGSYGNYMYSIDNGTTYSSSNSFTGLAAASYTVLVADENNCKIKKGVTVKTPGHPCTSFSGGSGGSSSSVAQMQGNLQVKVSPNPAVVDFGLQVVSGDSKNIVEVRVMDMQGKIVYHTRGSVYDMYRFGRTFAAGMYVAEVLNGKNTQRIKLVKSN